MCVYLLALKHTTPVHRIKSTERKKQTEREREKERQTDTNGETDRQFGCPLKLMYPHPNNDFINIKEFVLCLMNKLAGYNFRLVS